MKTKLILIAAAFGLSTANTKAQVTISSLNDPYSQNFDTLINVNNNTANFVNNTTIVGWYANSEKMDASSGSYTARDGGSSTSGTYSFGADSDSDRAFGYIGASTEDYFNLGLRLINGTGATIESIRVSYDGEQWRSGGNTSDNNNIFEFSYKTFASGLGSIPSSTSLVGWTEVNALDFDPPQKNLSGGALDGNLTANKTSFSNILVTGISWQDGDELWLRLTGNDGTGTDAGIGIDNFSITAVPEPSVAAMLLIGMGFLFRFLRKKK